MSFLWLLVMLFVWSGIIAEDLSTEKTRTGRAGEEITILCNYDRTRFAFYDKFWCRGERKSNCKVLCESKWSVTNCHDKRMSIQDNRYGKLVITMRDLVLEDGGTYWCGIKISYGNRMILVNLQITDVLKVYRMQQDMKHTVKEGEDVTMKCSYDKSSLVSYRKCFCQQVSSTQCNILADTKGFISEKYSKRIQIVDDNLGTVSFTMKTIVFEDSGRYSCEVEVEKLYTLASFEITVKLRTASLPGDRSQQTAEYRFHIGSPERQPEHLEAKDQEQYNCSFTTWTSAVTTATTTHITLIEETTTLSSSDIISSNYSVAGHGYFRKEWNYWRWIALLVMFFTLLSICALLKNKYRTAPRRDTSVPLMMVHE